MASQDTSSPNPPADSSPANELPRTGRRISHPTDVAVSDISTFSHTKFSPFTTQTAIEDPAIGDPFEGNLPSATLFRILDANLDRAREGMRILEEWCRFGLNDEGTTAQFKHLRQSVARWHTAQIRLARDTPGDLGTALTHPQEATRSSLAEVLRVNFARTQEALRVLEEYGKLYSAEMAAECKQMRYELYTLDSQILGPLLSASLAAAVKETAGKTVLFQQRYQKLIKARTYLVTSPVSDFLGTVEAALKGGTAIVQYREKTADDDVRLAMARKVKALCHRYNALFIVNDRVDIAAAADADGVHLGQQDLPMDVARKILGPGKIIGRSTTNPTELKRALAEDADYIGVGPVHETPTKPGKAAAGTEYVRYAKQHAPMPWFAIGGLNAENLGPTLAAGATRVAVVRALMAADDPEAIAQSLVQQMQQPPSSD